MKADRTTPSTPEVIRVERTGDTLRVLIDGVELPCEVDPSGVQSMVVAGAQPGITVHLPARRVEVVDAMEGRVSDARRSEARDYLNKLAP
ncbi:hypothetical protein GCM10023224_05070 [Streptomonospora halophila]|uniref:DUF3006 domain-containing protein n=1 Tax=Streptomonospora halophila TaxID=427369 RepID=A0ABP9G8S5_9ACTN